MSIDASRWAWQQPVTHTLKIVLLSLADRAGENNDCYPSLSRLALDCGMSSRCVIKAIHALENLGLILKVRRTNARGNTSNYYQLLGVSDRHSQQNKLVNQVHKPSEPRSQGVMNDVHYPSEPRSHRNNNITTTTNHHNNNIAQTPNNNQASLVDADVSLLSLDKSQKELAIKKLSALSPEQRKIAVDSFNKTVALGAVKSSPMALLNQLINLGLKNALESLKASEPMPTINQAVNQSIESRLQEQKQAHKTEEERLKQNKDTRIQVIKAFINNKKADFLAEFKRRGFVEVKGVGFVIEPDLKLAGLFD